MANKASVADHPLTIIPTTPPPTASPSGNSLECAGGAVDEWRDDYDDSHGECANCGGEGFTYGCSWDWQCDTYDESEGTCLCTRRCEWCHPLTPAEMAEREKLRDVLATALAKDKVAEMRSAPCTTCHGTGELHRQDCGSQGLTKPCPDCRSTNEAPEYTCASCNQFTDCQSAFGAPGEVGLGCADWQPAPTLTNGGPHA